MWFTHILYLTICVTPITVYGSNILFYFGVGSYSHRISVWPLAEALANKGHQVTFFFTQEPKTTHPNITEFGPKNMTDFADRMDMKSIDVISMRIEHGADMMKQAWKKFMGIGIKQCQVILTDTKVVDWIEKSNFDLLIINALFNDCALGLAHKFRAPFILFGTTAPFMWLPDDFGFLDESSYLPDLQMAYHFDMSFPTRVLNAVRPLVWQGLKHWFMFPAIESLFTEQLKMEDFPPLAEIQRNASLVFLNRHAPDDVARSLPPIMVPIAGMHITENANPLSQVRMPNNNEN